MVMEKNGESSNGSDAPSPVIEFSAGVVAGAAGLVVGQPFDVVKVRYQTPQFAGRYASTFTALGSILREEGTQGLFKGVTSPMAGIAFINGVVFASYSILMNLQVSHESSVDPSLRQIGIAGAGSGILGAFIACPTELIKIRQQSAPTHLNPSTLAVFREVIRADGLRGLYRGFPATALRDIAYGPYFCTYEAVCRFFKSQKPPQTPPPPEYARRHHHSSLIDEAEEEMAALRWPELMTAGGLAGVMAWLVTFPFDVFKTRMQSAQWPDPHTTTTTFSSSSNAINTNATSLRRLPPHTLRRVASEAIKNEGWRVMFAGLGPTLIRAVPVNMVIFLTYEGIVTALK